MFHQPKSSQRNCHKADQVFAASNEVLASTEGFTADEEGNKRWKLKSPESLRKYSERSPFSVITTLSIDPTGPSYKKLDRGLFEVLQ